jgi:hypothetical protein
MSNTIIPLDTRMSLREKVRLNIWIAQDLADSFGGRTADYLIPLNKKLKSYDIEQSLYQKRTPMRSVRIRQGWTKRPEMAKLLG